MNLDSAENLSRIKAHLLAPSPGQGSVGQDKETESWPPGLDTGMGGEMNRREDMRGEPDPTNLAWSLPPLPPPHHHLPGLDFVRSQVQIFLSTQEACTYSRTHLLIVTLNMMLMLCQDLL